jgi:acyl carrier protein
MKPEAVVADTFGKSLGDITDDSSPENIAEWDSLGHVTLVIELESAFGVSFSPEETVEMISVGQIKRVLLSHGATW